LGTYFTEFALELVLKMSSTVTTTTATTVNAMGVAGAFALVILISLIGFVIAKEIIEGSSGSSSGQSHRWGKALRLGVLPLGVSFVMIAVISLMVNQP
jgi:hypothetical protein